MTPGGASAAEFLVVASGRSLRRRPQVPARSRAGFDGPVARRRDLNTELSRADAIWFRRRHPGWDQNGISAFVAAHR
jgi:hypothetical protein